jgi:hypothetical protein
MSAWYLGTICERRQVFFRGREKSVWQQCEQIESQETNRGGEYALPLALALVA